VAEAIRRHLTDEAARSVEVIHRDTERNQSSDLPRPRGESVRGVAP
jgi:hypothetical protein